MTVLTKKQGGNLAASWVREQERTLEAYRDCGPLAVALVAGGATHGEVARVLNAAGHRVRRTGAPFSKQMVRYVLRIFDPE